MENKEYEKLGLLGIGAYGKVYRVRNRSTDEEYAMKIIGIKKKDQATFKNEVVLMERINRLSNRYLVKYITSYVKKTKPESVIIMEYCSGGDLKEIIKRYKNRKEYIPEDMVLKLIKQILLGVTALHKNSILHRDLKPGNILVDSKGNLKLSDFGISRQLSRTKPCARVGKGTLWYSSLEVLKGENHSFSADIWSLGCILHELCCLKPPCTENNLFIAVKWWEEKKYNTNVIPKNYSEDIKKLIISMLNNNRKLRPTCENLLSNKLFTNTNPDKSKVNELKDIEKYEGELKDGKPHGKGTYYWANGNKYKGDFKDSMKSGTGTFWSADGDRYEGEFEDNMKSGKGIDYYANGDKYEGEFKDNMKSGKGKYYFINGDRYEGEFKGNTMNGEGTLYKADGKKYKEKRKQGELIKREKI